MSKPGQDSDERNGRTGRWFAAMIAGVFLMVLIGVLLLYWRLQRLRALSDHSAAPAATTGRTWS